MLGSKPAQILTQRLTGIFLLYAYFGIAGPILDSACGLVIQFRNLSPAAKHR